MSAEYGMVILSVLSADWSSHADCLVCISARQCSAQYRGSAMSLLLVLAGPEMGQLLGTLEWGVRSDDAEVAQASLEALAVLASSQHENTCKGGPGFPALQGDTIASLAQAHSLDYTCTSVFQKVIRLALLWQFKKPACVRSALGIRYPIPFLLSIWMQRAGCLADLVDEMLCIPPKIRQSALHLALFCQGSACLLF